MRWWAETGRERRVNRVTQRLLSLYSTYSIATLLAAFCMLFKTRLTLFTLLVPVSGAVWVWAFGPGRTAATAHRDRVAVPMGRMELRVVDGYV
jgi:hypothetical protein